MRVEREHGRASWVGLGLAALAATIALVSSVSAAPPSPDSPELPEIPEQPAPPIAPELDPIDAGFWLSVELIGPRGAQLDAVVGLRTPPVVDELPRGGTPPPGELVGRVDTLAEALAWVDAHAFATLVEDEDATPVPGGRLYEEHGVYLTALIVTGAAGDATQPYPWPPAGALDLQGRRWRPASLTAARAPAFAAPAPTLPPASERYQLVEVEDSIWLLDSLERCDEAGTCLRWARILVRRGDRFFGAFVPASQIVPDDSWVGGPHERRFALIASHRDRGAVGFALIEERGARREAPVGIRHEHADTTWPSAGVEIWGEDLSVTIAGRTALQRHLDPPPPLTPSN